MSSNIINVSISEGDLNKLVKEWWKKLDLAFGPNKQIPKESIESDNTTHAFLYGHYDRTGFASGIHNGDIRTDHRDRLLLAPLVNGRYGTGDYEETAFGQDSGTGILMSQYLSNLYANILRDNREVIDIPTVHWISHELPRNHLIGKSSEMGFHYGVWICIDAQSLQPGDILTFGGIGGPDVTKLKPEGSSQSSEPNLKDGLVRFNTKAIWTVL